jgi:EAL domain-containing protein (putative c-di-GMP-specific phosphodiesterase class I)
MVHRHVVDQNRRLAAAAARASGRAGHPPSTYPVQGAAMEPGGTLPSEARPDIRPLGERERFVAFAFAAADLLLEVGLDGRIRFAAGAARARLGCTPEELVGAAAVDLIAGPDRAAFALAMALLPSRGRLAPTRFRLADAAHSAVAISGLCLGPARAGPLSLAVATRPAAPESRPPDAESLLTEARARLAAGGEDARIGLIEVLDAGIRDLRASAAAALGEAGGTLLAQLGPGRLGLLAAPGAAMPELGEVAGRLEQALGLKVDAEMLPLEGHGLTPPQATRALRHALSVFSRQGAAGLRQGGGAAGLPGVLAQVTSRAGALRRAIAMRRFHLDYQPIVLLKDRRVHHYEALLRPDRNLLGADEGPQEFVQLAETVGLTAELDLAVLAVALDATDSLAPGQRIAVNFSGLSVQDAAFREAATAALDARPDAAARLMVELTESAEIEDESAARVTLEALSERGLPVCLDDFGAGAAAFRYLKAFRVDYVKVDGSYVRAARTKKRERSFVSAMVDLSLAVGARVVAERIETEEDAALMLRLGVHCGQGWLFGRPGPIPPAPPPVAAQPARRGGAKEQWG